MFFLIYFLRSNSQEEIAKIKAEEHYKVNYTKNDENCAIGWKCVV